MISEIKFGDEIPPEGIGFYQWETWRGQRIAGQQGTPPLRFRWTGMNASTLIDGAAKKGMKILLMAGHPNIDKENVRVQIWGDRKKIREERLADLHWQEIALRPEELKDVRVLTFRVSRTWNPKLWGLSADSRDLGVAVAGLPARGERR
jgi:hypothetical protein